MNLLPWFGSLTNVIFPPSNNDNSLLILNPNPVPPYFLLMLPSTCLNDSNISCCLSSGIPIPLSSTVNDILLSGSDWIFKFTTPDFLVNLNAFDSKFFRICDRRRLSVFIFLFTNIIKIELALFIHFLFALKIQGLTKALTNRSVIHLNIV